MPPVQGNAPGKPYNIVIQKEACQLVTFYKAELECCPCLRATLIHLIQHPKDASLSTSGILSCALLGKAHLSFHFKLPPSGRANCYAKQG